MSIFRTKKKKESTEETEDDLYRNFRNKLAASLATTSKQLVWIFTVNGIAWIWCSYILAFQGNYQIAESLSSSVCTVIIGQLGFYLLKSTVENVSKYTDVFKRKGNDDNVGTGTEGSDGELIYDSGSIDFSGIATAAPDDSGELDPGYTNPD